jgi:hypothetical protein
VPYVISRPPRRALATVAACLGLLVTAAPAAASTDSCAIPASSPVFASLGDTASYFAVPGGTFEDAVTGWSLSGAQVVSGNEPFQVGGLGDSHSLSIAPGGVAASPTICVNSLTPTWRFFSVAENPTAPASQLTVLAQWTDPRTGHTFRLPIAHRNGQTDAVWSATPALILGKLLPVGMNVNIQLVFQAGRNGGGWSIDDVFVDPYAR